MAFSRSDHSKRCARLSSPRTSLSRLHGKIPYLRALPYASIEIILIVASVNVLVWIAAAIVLRFYPHLGASSLLAYTLGLRHALDADHISAIDLTTRQLLAARRSDGAVPENTEDNQVRNTGNKDKPVVTVGMWFSLGHSTIVILTTILVAATTAGISAHFDAFSTIGGIVGSSVSTAFLLLLGAINAWLLCKGIQGLNKIIKTERARIESERVRSTGIFQDPHVRVDRGNLHQQGSIEQQAQDTNPETISIIPSPISDQDPPENTKTAEVSKSTGLIDLIEVIPNTKPSDTNQKSDLRKATDDSLTLNLPNRSCLSTLLRWCLRLIDKPWKIYPLGVLFGLGFDTSSEIALLGITTLEASRSQSNLGSGNTVGKPISTAAIWAILIFPLLFTAGMCLLDTTDGALMYALYSRTTSGNSSSSSLLASSYANVILTGFTVFVALGVGILQMLNMLSNVLPEWRIDQDPGFWNGVADIGDRYDIIGGVVCGGFLVVAISGWAGYKKWKNWILIRGSRSDDESKKHRKSSVDEGCKESKIGDIV